MATSSAGKVRPSTRPAALAVAVAILGAPSPAKAGLSFAQLQTIGQQRIANENARHQAVLTELDLERQMADKKLADALKICTTTTCKAAQRADNLRTQNQLDVEEAHENAAHAAKLKQIKADIAAEEKANAASPAPGK
jgi:hypothetical protein